MLKFRHGNYVTINRSESFYDKARGIVVGNRSINEKGFILHHDSNSKIYTIKLYFTDELLECDETELVFDEYHYF